MSILNTELIKAVDGLVDEAQDLLSAPPESRGKEMREVILEAVKLGFIALELATKATPTRFDDMAVNALRYSGVLDALVHGMLDKE